MKRHIICRMFSFALAAVLVAESSISAYAAQADGNPESITETMPEDGTENVNESPEGGASVTEIEELTEGEQPATTEIPEESESTLESKEVPETESETETESEGEPETDSEVETEIGEIQTESETEISIEMPKITLDGAGAVLEAPILQKPSVSASGPVTLTWSTIADTDGYRVYRSLSKTEGWALLADKIVSENSSATYVDNEAQTGNIYYYKVCAYTLEEVEGKESVKEGTFSEIVDSTVAVESISLSETEVTLYKSEKKQLSYTYAPVHATLGDVTWTSENEDVVKVDEKGILTAVGEGKTSVAVKIGEQTAKCEVTVTAAKIILNKTEMTVRNGSKSVLKAVVMPANIQSELTWKSSNEAVAKVKNGEVEAIGAGETIITAKVGEITAECTVTVVVPVQSVSLEKESIEIEKGGTEKEIRVSIDPEYATNQEIQTEVADESMVSCIAEDGKLVLTSKERIGKTTVKVTVDGQSTVLTVSVVEEETDEDDTSDIIPVRRLKFIDSVTNTDLSEEEKTIFLTTEGENTCALKVKVLPAEATDSRIIWSSSDNKVAEVSNTGVVTAKGTGVARISAMSSNGISDRVLVVVNEYDDMAEEVKVEISNKYKDRTIYCYSDRASYVNPQPKTYQIAMEDTRLSYTYRSSDEKVATVNESGLVTAISPGKADIIALNPESGKSDAVTVTVERLVEEIKLPVSKTTIVVGTTMKLSAEVLPKEATDRTFKWKKVNDSKQKKAELNEEKQTLTAKEPGTIYLYATANDSGKAEAMMEIKIVKEGDSNTDDVSPISGSCSLTYNGKNSGTIKSGTSIQLNIGIKDKQKVDLNTAKKTIVYKSSNEKVATVDESGKVKAFAGGTAKVTATVMDGSNVVGTFTVTVEQRPEDISFVRDTYLVAPGGTVTLTPVFAPANTNSKYKKVSWEIIDLTVPEESNYSDDVKAKMITVNTSGKVTVGKTTPEGVSATLRCTSSAYDAGTESDLQPDKEVTIVVGKSKVTELKLKKTAIELTIEHSKLGEERMPAIEFTAKGADSETKYQWTSSDNDIIDVDKDSGEITVKKYGTAKVTLCVDDARTATATVTAYPVKKGQAIAAVSASYGIQQAEYDGNASVQLLFWNKTTKEYLKAENLIFTSSNPDLVYVDEKGIAYANPQAAIKKDTAVTITAALKDDPLKRKATTRVIVWKQNQIKRIDFEYWDFDGNKVEGITDSIEEKYVKQGSFKLKATAFGADNRVISGAKLSFYISDSTLASIKVDEKDKSGHTLIVTVKKPGKFKITCMAKDNMSKSKQLSFGIYDGKPILKTATLGTINKKSTVETETAGYLGHELVYSDTSFEMVGANGSSITGIKVSNAILKKKDNKPTTNMGGVIVVLEQEDGTYRLAMRKAELDTIKPGTYNITLAVRRTAMTVENDLIILPDEEETELITATFKIADTTPSVKIANTTVNSFEVGTWTKLNITTKEEIEEVKLATTGDLSNYYEVARMQDGWYIAIKEEVFDSCASKVITGKFNVKLKGYEAPVPVNVTVTAKSTKPSLKQLAVPDILIDTDKVENKAQIILYNSAKKENLTNYTVSLKSERGAKWTISQAAVSNQFEVTLTDSTLKAKNAAAYKQRIVVKKEGWRNPVELDVTVKASKAKTNPAVAFGKTSFTLNSMAEQETYSLTAKPNKGNVTLKEGDWTILGEVKISGKVYEYADLFTASYHNGELCIGLKEGAFTDTKLTASSFKLQFKNVFNEDGYSDVKTSQLTVSVNKKAPTISAVSFAGKLDLLNRKGSTLTGTVSISGINGNIKSICLANGDDSTFTDNFYCSYTGNKFTIYAREAAQLSVKAYTGKVKVTLENGYEMERAIKFAPTQSTPAVKAIASQTLYKAAADNELDYNLNKCMPSGVRINKLVTKVLPAGLSVEYDNGHAYVLLNDDTMKAETYTIEADVYFKGAQKITGSDLGKPVRVKIRVVVKEG